jgi:hypothetical protein
VVGVAAPREFFDRGDGALKIGSLSHIRVGANSLSGGEDTFRGFIAMTNMYSSRRKSFWDQTPATFDTANLILDAGDLPLPRQIFSCVGGSDNEIRQTFFGQGPIQG